VRLVVDCSFADLNPEAALMHLCSPLFDVSTFEIWGALLNGARLVIAPAETPSLDGIAQLLDDHEVTTLWLTSGLFHLMVDERVDGLGGIKQLLAGGDVVSATHARKFLERWPDSEFIDGYGPTENTTFTCCHSLRRAEEVGESVLIGRPIKNTAVYVLGEWMEIMPEGVRGELHTGGG